jgi:hypothetical protein
VGDLVLNVAKGRVAHYAALPAASDALVLVPLEAAGLVSDATMRDYDTLAAVLAGATNEATVGRRTLTNVTVTVDDGNDRVALDADDVVWTTPTGNPVGGVLICYDPDTTSGTDADLVPLSKHDLSWTPDGIDFTLTVAGFVHAT